jgi:inorganic pyrophosphatase
VNEGRTEPLWQLMGLLFKAHPWHGVSIGERAPDVVTAFIEIVPTDTVKYELDKATGLLKVDRPQRFSNVFPGYYGLLPKTYCGEKVAALMAERTGRDPIQGDGDPLDICVLAERTITHSGILLQAVPIGGLSVLDGAEADDKIIAVMEGDAAYGDFKDIGDAPKPLIDRLVHYFLTYKSAPDALRQKCEVTGVYGRDVAHAVIRASHDDYMARFSDIDRVLTTALRGSV